MAGKWNIWDFCILWGQFSCFRGRKHFCMYFEDMLVLCWPFLISAGIWTREKSRIPGESTRRRGGKQTPDCAGREPRNSLVWVSCAKRRPTGPVSVRFHFCISADVMMTPAKTPESSNHGALPLYMRPPSVWWAPAENIILVRKHKMKREEPTVFSSWDIACLLIHSFIIYSKLVVQSMPPIFRQGSCKTPTCN